MDCIFVFHGVQTIISGLACEWWCNKYRICPKEIAQLLRLFVGDKPELCDTRVYTSSMRHLH